MSLTLSPATGRTEALLLRIAVQLSELDGSRPGGALLGPRLLFLAAQERLADERLIRLGAAVEMIRRATLVHRVPQVERPWDGFGATPFSQTLRGDSLLAESFRLLAEDGEPRLVEVLSRAMAGVAAGEMEQHAGGPKAKPYLRLASFYAGVAEAGALAGRLNPADTVRYILWAREVGECHERARAGLPCPPDTVRRLESGGLAGTAALSAALLERLGEPDILWPEDDRPAPNGFVRQDPGTPTG